MSQYPGCTDSFAYMEMGRQQDYDRAEALRWERFREPVDHWCEHCGSTIAGDYIPHRPAYHYNPRDGWTCDECHDRLGFLAA